MIEVRIPRFMSAPVSVVIVSVEVLGVVIVRVGSVMAEVVSGVVIGVRPVVRMLRVMMAWLSLVKFVVMIRVDGMMIVLRRMRMVVVLERTLITQCRR